MLHSLRFDIALGKNHDFSNIGLLHVWKSLYKKGDVKQNIHTVLLHSMEATSDQNTHK